MEQEGFGPSGREQFKAFRDAEIHRLHEFVHEIGIDRKLGKPTISRICANTKTRWNILRIEDQVRLLRSSEKNKLTKKGE